MTALLYVTHITVRSASRIDGRSGSSSGSTKLRVVEWRKDVAMQRFCWRGAMPHMYLQDCQLGTYLDLFQRPCMCIHRVLLPVQLAELIPYH
eukprot:COSAG05_NODE_173_length_14969_cov_29.555884_4_plen_92_part_00